MNDTAERELMQSIHTNWGGAISSAAGMCSIPGAFFAALVANESGGKPNAKRFEPHVLAALWEVLLGRTPAYGSIKTRDLVAYITGSGANLAIAPAVLPTDSFQRVDALATSWGLTQIMGYEAIPFHLGWRIARANDPLMLADAATSLGTTVKMLLEFAARLGLDLTKDFPEMFDCWNTGRPHALTADPQYIRNGLARMALYQELEAASAKQPLS